MNINIINSVEQAHLARWIAVVIDVFRAFSTEAYIMNNGAKYIIPVMSLEEAFELRNKNPNCVLVWERQWIKPEWFDYGNSPTELEHINLANKVVIHTTTNGTVWLINTKNAEIVITWSFVNAWAIIKYIRQSALETVSLISTAPQNEENEDLILARYIQDVLLNKEIDCWQITEMIRKTSVFQYLFNEIWVPKSDFDLCLDINKFDFVIQQAYMWSQCILKRINV